MITAVQTEQFKQLWRAKNTNKLPHALLFLGVPGSGKAALADLFSRALLCERVSENGEPCQKCHACCLMNATSHPNLLSIVPEKEGQAIKVDQIRLVNEFVNQTSLHGGYRIVLIQPADEMNMAAANALLKTLEEPSSGALFILVCQQQGLLPATILSRCQRVVFGEPSREAVLKTCSPEKLVIREKLFKVLLEVKGSLKAASELHQHDSIQLLDFFLSWMMDLIRLQIGDSADRLNNPDYLAALTVLTSKTMVHQNVALMTYLQRLRSQFITGLNFNKQLVLEDILLRWEGCHACS